MTTQATNIAELKTYGASMSDGDSLEILGYYTAGDGGGGTFYWDATSTDTDNGGTIIQATGVTTGRWLRVYEGDINAKWFGIVGDCVADDTTAFQNAVTFMSSNTNSTLNISDCRIYLKTLAAPIDISDIEILGNGTIDDFADWPYMAGSDVFATHLTTYQASSGSGFVSNFAGAVFTGTTFKVRGCSLICNPTKVGSAGFIQTTPTVYPGSSNGISGDYKGMGVTFCNTYGIHLKGGLETSRISNLHISDCLNNCLFVDQTASINCPIDYLEFRDCSFRHSNSDNVVLGGAEGVAKQIKFHNCGLNGAGRYFTLGELATTYDDLKYSIRIVPKIGFNSLVVDNCYAEQIQGFVHIDGGYVYNIRITHNVAYYVDPTYVIRYGLAVSSSVVRGMIVRGNSFNLGTFNIYLHALTTESDRITVLDPLNSVTYSTLPPASVFVDQGTKNTIEASGSLGDGTAGAFTYQIDTVSTPAQIIGLTPRVYMVNANWQASNSIALGVYIMYVIKSSNGQYIANVDAISATGHTAPPTISTTGVITVNLAQYYRGKVTRIDLNEDTTYVL